MNLKKLNAFGYLELRDDLLASLEQQVELRQRLTQGGGLGHLGSALTALQTRHARLPLCIALRHQRQLVRMLALKQSDES